MYISFSPAEITFEADLTPPRFIPEDAPIHIEQIGDNVLNPSGDWYNTAVKVSVQAIDNKADGQEEKSGINKNTCFFCKNDCPTAIYSIVTTWEQANEAMLSPKDANNQNDEGKNTVYFIVSDNIGNWTDIISRQINIDTTPPANVKNPVHELVVVDNALMLEFSWDKVTQDFPDGGCGVAGYEIAWMRKGTGNFNSATQANGTITPASKTEYRIDLSDLERGVYYNFALRSVDKFKNASTWTVMNDVYIPPAVEIRDVTYLPSTNDGNDNPVYTTVLTLNYGKEILKYISDIELYRGNVHITAGNLAIKQNLDVIGNPVYPWGLVKVESVERLTFTSVFTNTIEENYAHRSYTYKAYTIHTEELGFFREYGNIYPDSGLPEPVPNYPVDFEIQIDDSSGNAGRANKEGCDANSDIEQILKIYRQEKLYLHLIPENGGIHDIEDDILKYRLKDINGAELLGWANAGIPVEFFPFRDDRRYSKAYMCYVEVEEYTENVTGVEQSLNGIYGDGYDNHRTIHLNEGKNEGFYIYFDFEQPAGIFAVKHRTEDRILAVNYPAQSREVRFFMREGALTDETGPIDSGIDGGLYIWNIDPGTLASVEYLCEEYIPYTEPDDPAMIMNIPMDLEPGVPCPEIEEPWLLEDGEDGYRITGMKVKDGSGNWHYAFYTLWLDTTPPGTPVKEGFRYSGTKDELFITFQPVVNDTIAKYVITYDRDNDGTEDVLSIASIDIDHPRFTIPVNGYDADEKVICAIKAIDHAGNESGEVVYEPYTLAEPGTLTGPEIGFDPATGYTLTWTLSGGKALKQELQILDEQFYPTGEVIEPVDNTFTHTGLSRGNVYNYRLLAYNSYIPGPGEDFIITVHPEIITVSLMNTPPGPPVNLVPRDFSIVQGKFDWDEAFDMDGDQLQYHVYIRKNSDPDFTLLATTMETGYPFPGDLFNHGDTCEWYVMSDDTPANGPGLGETAESVHVSFSVDGNAPRITIERPEGLYTNAVEMAITITETDSGIDGAVYWTSDDAVPAHNPEGITLTTDENGISSGFIPLHESGQPYTVYVIAADKAGNNGNAGVPSLYIDRTPPIITGIDLLMETYNGKYYSNNGRVRTEFLLSDNTAGIKSIDYFFVKTGENTHLPFTTINLEPQASANNPALGKTYINILTLAGNDGDDYSLVVRANDWAGNTSGEMTLTEKPVFLDTSPPEAALEVSGYTQTGSGYYISGLPQLSVIFEFDDVHSGNKAPLFTVKEEGNEALSWYTDSGDIPPGSLIPGKCYRVCAKAGNNVGLESVKQGDIFIYDNSPPEIISSTVQPQHPLVCNEQVIITLEASDLDSSIAEYRITVGTETDPACLSSLLSGEIDGRIIKKTAGESCSITFNTPVIDDGSYGIQCEAVNAAGLASGYGDFTLTVDNGLVRMLVWDTGPYTSSAATLKGRWEYHHPDEQVIEMITGYEYRIAGPGGPVTGWTFTGSNEAVIDCSLKHGETYRIEARTVFSDASYSDPGQSRGITVDTTAPGFDIMNGLVTPAACRSDNLWVSWKVSDPESGIELSEILLESYDAEGKRYSVSKNWIPLPCQESGDHCTVSVDAGGNPLELFTGQEIYLTLRTTNNAGIISEKPAPVIMIDDTPPPEPVVVDQGDFINTLQFPKARWIWSEEDPESKTTGYRWTIVQNPEDLSGAAWYTDDGSHRADVESAVPGFARIHGETWYFVVAAINGAGDTSTGRSNGIIYDETAPFIAAVKLLEEEHIDSPEISPDLHYITRTDNLHLFIDAFEDILPPGSVPPIVSYSGTYGTLDENLDWIKKQGAAGYAHDDAIIPLKDPQPVIGTGEIIVFKGEALNNAGLTEYGYSEGVKLDAGTPLITNVIGYVSGPDLHFTWDVICSIPLQEIFVWLKESENTGNPEWQSAGLKREIVFNKYAGNLPDGEYVLYVKAVNMLNRESVVYGISNGVKLDSSPPEIIRISCDAYANGSIRFYIEARDQDSGIDEYQYALGSFDDDTLFTAGWMSEFHTTGSMNKTIQLAELPSGIDGIKHNSQVYLSCRVKNKAGLWTEIMVNGPVLIDRTPPDIPLVSAPPYTTNKSIIEGIAVEIADMESGITRYQITALPAVLPLPATIDDWQTIIPQAGPEIITHISEENLTLADINLTHGTGYFVIVRAENGTGTWSEPACSAAVMTDTEDPVLIFTEGDREIIVNEAVYEVGYTVIEDVSGSVTITFGLGHPDTGGYSETVVKDVVPGEHVFLFDKTGYGTYELTASITDAAGNHVPEAGLQRLRLNSPPEITIDDIIETYPGRPKDFSAFVYDPDGDEPFTYTWDFLSNGEKISHEEKPNFAYVHINPYDPVTIFTLTLTVIDNGGKSSTAQAQIRVVNTQEGMLYVDEYWSGNSIHKIKGDIMVPENITLTILPGTTIEAKEGTPGDFSHRITIAGKLNANAGGTFRIGEGLFGKWEGIIVYGEAHFTGITIEDARWGLTITEGSEVTIESCTFRENEYGIHAYGVNQAIHACHFEGNTHYGIKEDAGAAPVITDCTFTGNTNDYYHKYITTMTGNGINTLPGNSGNTSDKEEAE